VFCRELYGKGAKGSAGVLSGLGYSASERMTSKVKSEWGLGSRGLVEDSWILG